MTRRTFINDHRDNPGLHKLYVAWAIETIEATDRFLEELYGHSRWPSSIVAGPAQEALQKQILEDAAFFEAAAIIKAGGQEEYRQLLREKTGQATHEEAEAAMACGAETEEADEVPSSKEILEKFLEEIGAFSSSPTGRITPLVGRLVSVRVKDGKIESMEPLNEEPEVTKAGGEAPTLEEIFNGSPWAWLDSIVRPSPRAAISKVMSREEFGKLKPGLYAYAISPLEDGNLLVTSMMD